jgi:DNA repair protein RadC
MSDTVRDIPLDERPREKLLLRGAHHVSDAELLAILLRTGTKGKSVIKMAMELIAEHGNLASLATKSSATIRKISGIGKDKAATLLAAFEITRRVQQQSRNIFDKPITSPDDVAEYFIPRLRDEMKELFLVICLSSANKIIKHEVISEGSLDSTVVHPREVFKVAIENNAKSIIIMHNHPSGNINPSQEDIAMTKKLAEAGKVLDIPVFDHIVIGGNNYTSFAEKKYI